MQESLPLLLTLTAIVLIFGIVAFITIVLTARQCACKQKMTKDLSTSKSENEADPWKEAAKRLKYDFEQPK